MWGSIKYNLSHLLDFSGRDARQTFWYYVLFLFVLNMAVGLVTAVPLVGGMLSAIVTTAQSGDEAAVAAAMGTQMGEMIGSMVWVGVFTAIGNVLLLAAALTRRLHDSNLSGWWGLLPLAVQAASSWYTTTRIDEIKALTMQMMNTTDPQAAMAAQTQMSGQSWVGWVAIIVVVVFGVRKSTPGPNRYAEAPVRF
jgi:uncharacterized membrane protein YhaH (DUF805 family)